MDIDISEHLNPKIAHHCLPLFQNKHYPECAHTAMKQVELNLNKKLGIVKFTPATKTIMDKFSKGKGVRLKVPFGEEQQENAKILFQGAFKYYRNHAAHQDQNISKKMALRIMVIGSELLDLLDVCVLNIDEIGGIEEVKSVLGIKDDNALYKLLSLINGYHIPDDTWDGFYEDLPRMGIGIDEFNKLYELNLINYECAPYVPFEGEKDPIEELGFFSLTDLGQEVVEILAKNKA